VIRIFLHIDNHKHVSVVGQSSSSVIGVSQTILIEYTPNC